jgi:hypothetical protein
MVSTAQERAALVIRNRNKRNEEMTYKVGYAGGITRSAFRLICPLFYVPF